MLRLLLDENKRSESYWMAIQAAITLVQFDVVRVGDENAPARGTDDGLLLDWVAAEQRILISFDKRTLPKHLNDILANGGHSPGIIFLSQRQTPTEIAEYLQLVASSSTADEWADTYRFIP